MCFYTGVYWRYFLADFSQLVPWTGLCLVSACTTLSKSRPVPSSCCQLCTGYPVLRCGVWSFVEGAASTAMGSGPSRVGGLHLGAVLTASAVPWQCVCRQEPAVPPARSAAQAGSALPPCPRRPPGVSVTAPSRPGLLAPSCSGQPCPSLLCLPALSCSSKSSLLFGPNALVVFSLQTILCSPNFS